MRREVCRNSGHTGFVMTHAQTGVGMFNRIGAIARAVALAATVIAGAGCASASPKSFNSPEAGVEALVGALRPYDESRAVAVLGPEADDVLVSGDPVADENTREAFLAAYDRRHRIVTEDDGSATLLVGDDDWPMPIPLVRSGGTWRFDTASGKDEILNRRIGNNELSTIEVCRAIVDAQQEYADADPTHSGSRAYAPKFLSDPGARNGLFWETREGEPPSPLGELVAEAVVEGYPLPTSADRTPQPYHGYYYKMLTAQGPSAPGGARSYVERGHLTGGFGVVAWPADYLNSGVMTFMVNQDGVVYQRDLGPDTALIAGSMTAFDPDASWVMVP
jgi:hypothetical protein